MPPWAPAYIVAMQVPSILYQLPPKLSTLLGPLLRLSIKRLLGLIGAIYRARLPYLSRNI